MTHDDQAPGLDGWDDMARRFEQWGMPVPPAPATTRQALRPSGPFCWATRTISGFDMYMAQLHEPAAFLAGQCPDYMAVSHSGHGLNSYAITYHLVHKGLAIFAQESWGGGYMDHDAQPAAVANMLDRCHDCLTLWEAHGLDEHPHSRLLCIHSDFRGYATCGWAPPTPPGSTLSLSEFLRHHDLATGDVFTHALQLMTERAGDKGTRAGDPGDPDPA